MTESVILDVPDRPLGEVVKAWMKRAGLKSQADLVRASESAAFAPEGVLTAYWVSRLFTGTLKEPSKVKYRALALALGVPESYLLLRRLPDEALSAPPDLSTPDWALVRSLEMAEGHLRGLASSLREQMDRLRDQERVWSLQIVPLTEILLHERWSEDKVKALLEGYDGHGPEGPYGMWPSIKTNGLLNPVILGTHPRLKGAKLLLDGSNRTEAIRRAGFGNVCAQVVPYDHPNAVTLGRWGHVCSLRPEHLVKLGGRPAPAATAAQDWRAGKVLIAAFHEATHGKEETPRETPEALVFDMPTEIGDLGLFKAVSNLYVDKLRRPILGADPLKEIHKLLLDHPSRNAVVLFGETITKDRIVSIADEARVTAAAPDHNLGKLLMNGFSRHVLNCSRVLGCYTRPEFLKDARDPQIVTEAMLDELRRRPQRRYQEPVTIYGEGDL